MEQQVQDVVAEETTNDTIVEENATDVLEPFSPDFNPETGQFTGNEKVASEQPVADQEVQPQENRYEYWQSKYDQKVSEYNQMEQRIKELENVEPIAKHIQENPWVLDNVASSLSGNTPKVAGQSESQGLPKKPERPNKPSNYDPSEAYMDPESASFKYRDSLDNYREELVSYQENMENYRQKEADRQYQLQQQKQSEEMAKQQQLAMANNLVNSYGYTPEKASDFIKYYSSPDSVSLENLVALDRLRNAPSTAEVDTRQKAEMMKNRQNRVNIPPPPSVGGGENQPQYSDEDLFNLGLMQKKRNA
jgi:ATPase subunit of ABC transporter with duplicated ATPase domains